MIEKFASESAPMSDVERDSYLPYIVKRLKNNVGEKMAVCNAKICNAISREFGTQIKESRLRKIINVIRRTGEIDCLLASNKGYYVADNAQDVKIYIESLKQRESAIKEVREALEYQFKRKFSPKQAEIEYNNIQENQQIPY